MTRGRSAAITLASLLIATAASAAGNDYKLDSRDWNGLSRLVQIAKDVDCTIEPTETLDWSTLDARDAVWFVYPRSAVDGATLKRYLAAGGRAVVADDFGAGDEALASLGIHRLRGTLAGVERFDGNDALPIARQTHSTELSVGIIELVGNHPAFFTYDAPLEATYEFAPGAALVVEGRLGPHYRGYFVAISDPSILINNMLEIEGDVAFARALVKRTCKPGERIRLVTQSFVARGEPPSELGPVAPQDSAFVRFNRMLESIDELIHAALYGRVAAVVDVACAVVALMLFWRAWPAPGRIDGDWTRAPAVETGWRGWDLSTATTLLRDEVALRLSEAIGDSVRDLSPAELRRRMLRAYGTRTADLAAAVWTQVRRAPPFIGRARLQRLRADTTSLFDALAERRDT